MQRTAELLKRALNEKTPSEWARMFNVVPSTITNARKAGRLSPGLAGNIAAELGEDAKAWMLQANMENEREAVLMNRLRTRITSL